MQNGFFKTFDGTRIYYEVDGQGPPLLFCYGLVCSKLHWHYQMEFFKSKGFTVIWFDYRGHHNSETPKDPKKLTIENIAKDGLKLLDELNLPQVEAVLGHSMGVNVVLEIYRQAPHRMRSLVLANGSARAPLETMFRSNLLEVAFPYLHKAYEKYPKFMNLIWEAQGRSKIVPWVVGMLGFNPSLAKQEDIEAYVRLVAKIDIGTLVQLLSDYQRYDATPMLDKISVPTLIVSGENDLVIPKEAQEIMHQLIPDSRYELIRNGSHCPQLDIPELINLLLDRFLTDVLSVQQSLPKAITISSPVESREPTVQA